LRGSNPALKIQIETIEAFLVELDKLIAFPRIVQVEKEKLVEVNKNIPILVPTLDI
jgi:hemerythrin superfamily protein